MIRFLRPISSRLPRPNRLPAHGTFVALLGVALAVAPTPVAAQALTEDEARIAAWVDAHVDEAIDLLERIVRINSGTLNPEGVRRVADVLAPEFEAIGLETEWVEQPAEMNRGGHLFARTDAARTDAARTGGAQGRKILLIGHLDTVFEEDDPFTGFTRTDTTATGPGVSDMKSGDIAILYALKALHATGALDNTAVTVALTGDEESPGSPLDVSRHSLVEAGKWADVALGFEGAMRDERGEYATVARRSSSGWFLEVTGRQAHSSGIFSEDTGAGAIFEAARILDEFYDEIRGEEYLTFNAGTIVGGTEVEYDREQNRGSTFGKTNVVPQKVYVHGGIRTISDEQLERAREAMRRVVARNLPRTEARISFTDGYPAMSPTEGNQRLYEMLDDVSQDLGLGSLLILDPGRRGAADISFVAPYTDGLAALGLHGGSSHAPGEWVDLRSLAPSIKRAALLIYRLTREEVERTGEEAGPSIP